MVNTASPLVKCMPLRPRYANVVKNTWKFFKQINNKSTTFQWIELMIEMKSPEIKSSHWVLLGSLLRRTLYSSDCVKWLKIKVIKWFIRWFENRMDPNEFPFLKQIIQKWIINKQVLCNIVSNFGTAMNLYSLFPVGVYSKRLRLIVSSSQTENLKMCRFFYGQTACLQVSLDCSENSYAWVKHPRFGTYFWNQEIFSNFKFRTR